MKAIIISLIIILSNFQILPQENLGWRELEIFMMTANLPSGDTIRYKMEAVGTIWHTTNFSNYYTTTEYNIAYYPPITDSPTGNTDWTNQASVYGSTYGFNFIPVSVFFKTRFIIISSSNCISNGSIFIPDKVKKHLSFNCKLNDLVAVYLSLFFI